MLNNGDIFNKGFLISTEDGTVIGKFKELFVSDGSLTDNLDGTATLAAGGGSGVTYLYNSDGTISVSSPTGTVSISLNLNNFNTWNTGASFNDGAGNAAFLAYGGSYGGFFSSSSQAVYAYNGGSGRSVVLASTTGAIQANGEINTGGPFGEYYLNGFLIPVSHWTNDSGYITSADIQEKVLYDHVSDIGNNGTGEDNLYSDTLDAGILATNGDKIVAHYAGIIASNAVATRQIRAYFGGTAIFDSTAVVFSASADWNMEITVIRESSSVVRCAVEFNTTAITAAPLVKYTRVTGLTLASTQIIKITGEAAGVGAATNDVIAKLGYVEYKKASPVTPNYLLLESSDKLLLESSDRFLLEY